jgi:hypothetical protein
MEAEPVQDDAMRRLIEWQKQRRNDALSEVAFIERQLIEVGEMEGPTTGELRKLWREGKLVMVI